MLYDDRARKSSSTLHHQMTGVPESAKKYYKIDAVTGEAVPWSAEGLALPLEEGVKKTSVIQCGLLTKEKHVNSATSVKLHCMCRSHPTFAAGGCLAGGLTPGLFIYQRAR